MILIIIFIGFAAFLWAAFEIGMSIRNDYKFKKWLKDLNTLKNGDKIITEHGEAVFMYHIYTDGCMVITIGRERKIIKNDLFLKKVLWLKNN